MTDAVAVPASAPEASPQGPESADVLRPLNRPVARAPVKAGWRFMLKHPAHWVALGFGSGLSPVAPGTIGTLWAWVAWLVFEAWRGTSPVGAQVTDLHIAMGLGVAFLLGWWACTVTAAHMATADPSAIVWDEILAFWLILWLVLPTSLWGQLGVFVLFRVLDALKPGPIGWADGLFHMARGYRGGFGILFDDLMAAFIVLIVVALIRF